MKTPQKPYPELAHFLDIKELWLKREDLHPYGSHKGRSIPLMIKEYAKLGSKNFCISSSGNAALAALIAVQKHNQNNPGSSTYLTIFVGLHIEKEKLNRLESVFEDKTHIQIKKVENPKQMAFQMEKIGEAKNLRQSTDDLALKGYLELADDLSKIPNLQAVFIPTSSGTTAQALGESFLKMQLPIQIHIIQTSSCHPMAEIFDTVSSSEESIAGAIVDKVAHRKEKIVSLVKQTGGSGWIISNTEIEESKKLLNNMCDVSTSANAALSLAGVKKAIQNNWTWTGAVVCLITGK